MVHPHNDSIWRTEDAEYHRGQGRIVGAHSGDVGHPRSRMPYCDSTSATAFRDLVDLEVVELCRLLHLKVRLFSRMAMRK
jgi:hypothetical protein